MYRKSSNKFTLSMQYENCEYYAVQLQIIDKQRFGILRNHTMTLARWTAGYPTLVPTILGNVFTADTRLGENYNDQKTRALGEFLWNLGQEGWELVDNADLHAEVIFLRKPKDN